jgi:glycine cleavage system protein P-like pyridoxal-binding family
VYYLDYDWPNSVGKVRGTGPRCLEEAAELSVLKAKYINKKLRKMELIAVKLNYF